MSIDIFTTPLRKQMLFLMKKQEKQQPIIQEKTFNISYPIKAQQIEFNSFPGPCTYHPKIVEKQNKINFSSSQRQSLVQKQITDLGPGSFEVKKYKSQSIKIGTSIRPPLAIPSSAPLPGAYEYKSKMIETQGIKFKGASFDPIIKEIHSRPGPGKYEQELQNVAPKYLFPKAQRYDFVKKGVPGPKYEVQLQSTQHQAPSYSFGKEKREQQTRIDSPGPGSYEN